MRWPITYILSASVAGLTLAVGAYVLWHSFFSYRMVLNKFPELATTSVARDIASKPQDPMASAKPEEMVLYSLDEVLVNINQDKVVTNHLFRLKLELELFEPETRSQVERQLAGVKHTVIETARSQDFNRLNTLDGKLYFKEELVSRLNEFFRKAAIRRVHFTTFFLQ